MATYGCVKVAIFLVLAAVGLALSNDFDSAEEYFGEWRKSPYHSRLLPFGEQFLDEDVFYKRRLDFDRKVPFMGGRYNFIGLQIDGYLTFGMPGFQFTDQILPIEDWPRHSDPPMLAPFFAGFKGEINFCWARVLLDGSDVSGAVSKILLRNITGEIRQNVLGAEHFEATGALVTTWEAVESMRCTENCESNTFQTVVATDTKQTIAIFVYDKVSIAGTSTDNECSNACALGQAGINIGQATGFVPLPFSRSKEITLLDDIIVQKGQRGVYYWDVTEEKAVRGGCLDDERVPVEQWPISVWPDSVSMLGGTELIISALCLDLSISITCQFGSTESISGYVIDEVRSGCITPTMKETGEVSLRVTQGSRTFDTTIRVLDVGQRDPDVILVDPENTWFTRTAESLNFRWSREAFVLHRPDTDNPPLASRPPNDVTVELYGLVSSDVNGDDTEEWTLLSTQRPVNNDGDAVFEPEDCNDFCGVRVGALKLSADTYQSIWSDPFPLGWYSSHSTEAICAESRFVGDIEETPDVCPCTQTQAQLDVGNYVPFCGYPDTPECIFHRIAEHCLISHSSVHPTKCCYKEDGNVISVGDLPNEGSFILSQSPFASGLDYLTKDMFPFVSCCRWTDLDSKYCADHFMEQRTPPGCSEYNHGSTASAFGDPHFVTFDGVEYTFNGLGEYVFVKVTDDLIIQGRFEQPPKGYWFANQDTNATMLTAIVIKEKFPEVEMKTLEISLIDNRDSIDWLSVFSGTDQLQLDSNIAKSVLLPDGATRITVHKSDSLAVPSLDEVGVRNVSVSLASGTSLNVAAAHGMLLANVRISLQYKDQTFGLLGTWNNASDDDLTSRSGTVVSPTDPLNVYRNFGRTWAVSESESIFNYRHSESWNFYNAEAGDFLPEFDPHPDSARRRRQVTQQDGPTVTPFDLNSACGESQACRYDYLLTKNEDLARDTRSSEDNVRAVRAILQSASVACGVPEISRARRTVTGYVVGSRLDFIGCDDDYVLSGSTVHTCAADGLWSPPVDASCKPNSSKALVIGLSVAAAVVVLALLALVAFVVWRKKKAPASPKRGGSYQAAPRDDAVMAYERSHTAANAERGNLSEWASGLNDEPPRENDRPQQQRPAQQQHYDYTNNSNGVGPPVTELNVGTSRPPVVSYTKRPNTEFPAEPAFDEVDGHDDRRARQTDRRRGGAPRDDDQLRPERAGNRDVGDAGRTTERSRQNRPGYAEEEPRHGKEPRYEREEPTFDLREPAYYKNEPRHGREEPRQERVEPRYAREEPRYGPEEPRHGREEPRYGPEEPRHGREEPRHGREEPRHGREEPRYGKEEPRHDREEPRYGRDEQRHERPDAEMRYPTPDFLPIGRANSSQSSVHSSVKPPSSVGTASRPTSVSERLPSPPQFYDPHLDSFGEPSFSDLDATIEDRRGNMSPMLSNESRSGNSTPISMLPTGHRKKVSQIPTSARRDHRGTSPPAPPTSSPPPRSLTSRPPQPSTSLPPLMPKPKVRDAAHGDSRRATPDGAERELSSPGESSGKSFIPVSEGRPAGKRESRKGELRLMPDAAIDELKARSKARYFDQETGSWMHGGSAIV